MKVFFLLIVCFVSVKALTQNTSEDQPAIDTAISLYHRLLRPETGLYNGREYVYYAFPIQSGSPFFLPDFDTGSVVYNKMLYENVAILYDLITDEAILREPLHLNRISLIKERVAQFTIAGHQFVRLTRDSTRQTLIKTGFYELLYSGKSRLYKKQHKTIQETLSSSEGIERKVEETIDYFAEIKNIFYEVNNKTALLNAIKDKKNDIQQFVRKNKWRFKKTKETELANAMKYYDSL